MKKLVLLGTAFLLFSSAQAGMYKWVDESGNVHYSSTLPASASKKAHTRIGGSGLVKTQIDPEGYITEATEKQLMLDQHAIEQARLDKVAREKRIIKAKKQRRDNRLLSTYDSKGELIHYFETKIKLLKGNSNILQTQSSVLLKKITRLEEKRAGTSHEDTIVSIDNRIVNINKSLEQYDKALIDNEKEVMKVSSNYRADKKRFIELTQ